MKTVQIIPATDWYALYDEGEGKVYYCPLTCWSLLEDDRIVGMSGHGDGYVSEADDVPSFLGYEFRPEINRPKLSIVQDTDHFLRAMDAFMEEMQRDEDD